MNIGTLARVRSGTNQYAFLRAIAVRVNVGTTARMALAFVVARVAVPAPVDGILAVALAVCASLVRPKGCVHSIPKNQHGGGDNQQSAAYLHLRQEVVHNQVQWQSR